MKKFIRAIALIIAISIVVTVFAGCGKKDFGDVLKITVDAGTGEKSYTVSYDLYRVVMNYLKTIVPNAIKKEDGSMQLPTKKEQNTAIKEVTENTLLEFYALVAMADDYGIKITEEDKKQFAEAYDAKIKSFMDEIDKSTVEYDGTKEEYAKEMYVKSLKIAGTTPEYYEFTYYKNLLEKRLKLLMSNDLSAYLKDTYFHYKQIVVLYTKGDAVAEEKAFHSITEARKRLAAGENIDILIREYSSPDYLNEVYFDAYGNIVASETSSTISNIVMNAIKALQTNEISDIMSGDESARLGYFAVYQRLGFDEEYICGTSNIANQIYKYSYVGSEYFSTQYTKYMTVLNSYKQNIIFVPVDAKEYKKLTINTVK